MKINNVNALSFKAYVPVQYFLKSEKIGENQYKYIKAEDEETVKKCQRMLVSSLNAPESKNSNLSFVDKYKSVDNDYRKMPLVRSYYDYYSPKTKKLIKPDLTKNNTEKNSIVRPALVTGLDANEIDLMAKPIGIAKAEALDRYGRTDTYKVRLENRTFFDKQRNFILRPEKRIQTEDGSNMFLRVYFNPIYYTKGARKGELKSVEYVNSRWLAEKN